MTLTERKSRHEIIRKLDSKSSERVTESLKELLESYGPQANEVFKTITSDNGSEFALLPELEKTYETRIYYAHPYSSCERGTNERHNGLIRRFIPKGKSINDYSVAAIARIASWMNTLPRRILGYWTPDEVFAKHVSELETATFDW
jgi:IS30 family transposase